MRKGFKKAIELGFENAITIAVNTELKKVENAVKAKIEDLQAKVDYYSTAPIEDFFKDGLRLERRLAIIRRLNWYLLMRWSGRKRAKHLGTFSISNLGHLGGLNLHHPIVTATSLAMGPIQPDGHCDLALISDHRVLDGVLASRAILILLDAIGKATYNN